MSVAYLQPGSAGYPSKRRRTDTMAAPVFFRIDEKHSPFPLDDRPHPSDDDSQVSSRPDEEISQWRKMAKVMKGSTHRSVEVSCPDEERPHRRASHVRQSSETPSIISMSSSTTSLSDTSTIRIRQPASFLPRTESLAIENEVLTIRHLSKLTLYPVDSPISTRFPVPSILRLLRDRTTHKLTSAILEKPSGIPLSTVSWNLKDPRRERATATIAAAAASIAASTPTTLKYPHSTPNSGHFGPVASVCAGTGRPTWRSAFLAMFDALLLDAEDSWVNLPYGRIRNVIAADRSWTTGGLDQESTSSRHSTDKSQSQLVIPEFGDERKVMVEEDSGEVIAFVGFQDAFWGDPELLSQDAIRPEYVAYQAMRVLALESVRPGEKGPSGRGVLERSRLMTALGELEGRVAGEGS